MAVNLGKPSKLYRDYYGKSEKRTANKVLIPARLSKLGFETLRQKGRVSAYERFVSRTRWGLVSHLHPRTPTPIETSLLDEDPPAARSQMQTVSDGSCQTGIDPPSARPFAGYDGLSSYWVMRVQDHPTTYYVAATTVMAWRIVKYFSDPRQPPAAARKRSCQLPFLRSCRFRSNL